jgi:hypothetical protein
MADGGAPSGGSAAASPELIDLLARCDELSSKTRFEPAAAKAMEAAALARATAAPHSLLRAYALLQHAECAVAQRGQLFERGNTGNIRSTYDAEERLCAAAYASLVEALPILLARGEAGTLLPGSVPAEEEEAYLRLVVLGKLGSDRSAAAVAAATAADRPRRRGQRLGYQLMLQAACFCLLALYPAVFNTPFPSLNTTPGGDNTGRDNINALMNCVLNAVRWLGASVSLDGVTGAAGVQWQLGGIYGLAEESKLAMLVPQVLNPTVLDERGRQVPNPLLSAAQLDSPFRRTLDKLWNSPQLATRRRLSATTAPLLSRQVDEMCARAAADAARLGLATCGTPGCGRVESCPKAFKVCSQCRAVKYCTRECQKAGWKAGHKRECAAMAGGAGGSGAA